MNTGNDTGTPITDEMLSAYLDVEVSPDAKREIDAARATTPFVDARLRQFQQLDSMLKGAFPLNSGPVRQDLVDMINNPPGTSTSDDKAPPADTPSSGLAPDKPTGEDRNSAGHGQSEPASTVRRLRPRAGASVFSTQSFVPAALAASLALIVGYGAGQVGAPAPDPAPQRPSFLALIDSAHPYHRLLEETVSGTRLPIDGENAIYGAVSLTYVDAEGAYCREFSLAAAGSDNAAADTPGAVMQGGIRAVACRTAAGWRIEFLQRINEAPAHLVTDGKGYVPVSDGSVRALDAFLDETMDGDALGTDREQSLIARGWSVQ